MSSLKQKLSRSLQENSPVDLGRLQKQPCTCCRGAVGLSRDSYHGCCRCRQVYVANAGASVKAGGRELEGETPELRQRSLNDLTVFDDPSCLNAQVLASVAQLNDGTCIQGWPTVLLRLTFIISLD